MNIEKLKYHWNENVKPVVMFILIGIAIVLGFRLGDFIWPPQPAKLLICTIDEVELVEQCKVFDRQQDKK